MYLECIPHSNKCGGKSGPKHSNSKHCCKNFTIFSWPPVAFGVCVCVCVCVFKLYISNLGKFPCRVFAFGFLFHSVELWMLVILMSLGNNIYTINWTVKVSVLPLIKLLAHLHNACIWECQFKVSSTWLIFINYHLLCTVSHLRHSGHKKANTIHLWMGQDKASLILTWVLP